MTRSYRTKIRAFLNAPPNPSATFLGKMEDLVGIGLFYQRDFPVPYDKQGNLPPEFLPVILDLVEDRDQEIRCYSVSYLGCFKNNERAINTLIRLLDDDDEHIRYDTIDTLRRLGPNAKAARHRLAEMVKEQGTREYVHAAEALWEIGTDKKVVIPAYIHALEDSDEYVRSCAFSFFEEHVTSETESAVPILTRIALKGKDAYDRRDAVHALDSYGKSTVPTLVKAVQDEHFDVRLWAIISLGRVGPDANAGAPALRRLLKDRDQMIREACEQALKDISPKVAK